ILPMRTAFWPAERSHPRTGSSNPVPSSESQQTFGSGASGEADAFLPVKDRPPVSQAATSTGVSLIEPELEAKRLEIMKEMLPAAWRFAVLSDRDVVAPARLQAVEDGARADRMGFARAWRSLSHAGSSPRWRGLKAKGPHQSLPQLTG